MSCDASSGEGMAAPTPSRAPLRAVFLAVFVAASGDLRVFLAFFLATDGDWRAFLAVFLATDGDWRAFLAAYLATIRLGSIGEGGRSGMISMLGFVVIRYS